MGELLVESLGGASLQEPIFETLDDWDNWIRHENRAWVTARLPPTKELGTPEGVGAKRAAETDPPSSSSSSSAPSESRTAHGGGGGGLYGITAAQMAFLFLDGPADVLRAATACRRWRELAGAGSVWQAKAEREGILACTALLTRFVVETPLAVDEDGGEAWLLFYRRVYPLARRARRVKRMYKVVHKCTGSLGGNGAGGSIYGELTRQSMQNVTEFMCLEGELGPDSIFIDIGAGLGKPNLHVALDPQVRFSVGIDHENVRWQLSLHNLKHVLAEPAPLVPPPPKCIFLEADAYDAKSFDPFTHVYMFDIGFPPNLFLHIAECLRNSSSAKWVLCYHGPKLMCNEYGFEMELVKQLATSMHGSGEGHTAYLYKCTHAKARQAAARPAARPTDEQVLLSSDPVWKGGLELLAKKDVSALRDWVRARQTDSWLKGGGRFRKTLDFGT